MKVSLVTLGCSKNEVDSEMILGYLKDKGYKITTDIKESEIIIVNTCGFIKSAKEEAISTILDMADYKKQGKCKYLVVVGCLAKRYKEDIIKEFKEVDLVIGADEYKNIDKIFSNYFKLQEQHKNLDFKKRIVSTTFPMAYIRISDGCNNRCHYCAIPLIRGSLQSRRIEDIVEEAKHLASKGIRELVIISQDTTSYGLDIYGKHMLTDLLKALGEIEDLKWIRILYMYPGKITDELIEEIKNNEKICKYFDIPIQHISDNMLQLMNRHTNKLEIINLIKKIRKEIPEAIIRTTVMVGYQGETNENFLELIEYIKLLKFERLGAFTFSKEEDTVADSIEGDVPESVKKDRFNILMRTQQEVISEIMKSNIGRILEVLVQDITEDEKFYVCRSYMDAPDVDPKILLPIKNNTNVIIGEWYNVKVVEAVGYDYICELFNN